MEMKESGNCINSQLWQACAGSVIQMPMVDSLVYYSPQGHAEHAQISACFNISISIPPLILCRVASVKLMADSDNDDVFANIAMIPVKPGELNPMEGDDEVCFESELKEKLLSHAKTVTQSDANSGGGLSVPRYCADYIFPKLDYSAAPPVQILPVKDVHGKIWNFRHIFRGTPRRHLLTTGWSNFVNEKRLVAGDSVVFLRADGGDVFVGIRRAKGMIGAEKLNADSVMEAASLAARGEPLEVVYYPNAGTPEYFVKASAVRAALRVSWCAGMRIKMPIWTEESSRIRRFFGTVSSVQFADPIRWPGSFWKLLEVTWDDHDHMKNVKRVSPWSVELDHISDIVAMNLTSFSPPRKRLWISHNPDSSLNLPFPNPILAENSLIYGIQGAAHNQHGVTLQELDLFCSESSSFSSPLKRHRISQNPKSSLNFSGIPVARRNQYDILHAEISMGAIVPNCHVHEKARFMLFGKEIVTEPELTLSINGSTCTNSETLHHKVFMEKDCVGRTLDLAASDSYEVLYERMAAMFGIEKSELSGGRILYQHEDGTIKRTEDEPFEEFIKESRKLVITMDPSFNSVGK